MKCPRCNSKVPDNFSHCGFCGIEFQTGRERILDVWIQHLDCSLAYNSDRFGESNTRLIASMTLIILSIITLVESYPFSSLPSLTFAVLSVVGILGGIFLLSWFLSMSAELNTINAMISATQRMILYGELKSTQDIINLKKFMESRLHKQLKHSNESQRMFLEDLYGDDYQSAILESPPPNAPTHRKED